MEAYYLAFAGVVRASDLALFLGEQGAAVADFGKQLKTSHFGYLLKVPRRRVLVTVLKLPFSSSKLCTAWHRLCEAFFLYRTLEREGSTCLF